MAEPIFITPGQVVGWDDFNAILAQHGSPRGAKSVEIVQQKPKTKEEIAAIEEAGGDPNAPTVNPVRRYHFEDGSYVEAITEESASAEESATGKAPLRIVKYEPSLKFQQANKPPTKAEAAANTRTRTITQGTPDPSKPDGYDNERPREIVINIDTGAVISDEPLVGPGLVAWESDRQRARNGGLTDAQVKERDAKAAADKKDAAETPAERVNPSDNTRIQRADGKGGWIDAGPNDAEAQKRAKEAQAEKDKNRPKPELVNGVWGYFDTSQTPPVWTPIQNAPPGEPPPVVTVGGVSGYWKRDEKGIPTEFVELPTPASKPMGAGAPKFTPDTTKDDFGIGDYYQQLQEARRAGVITQAQGTELLDQAGAQATLTASAQTRRATQENQNRTGNITQRGQDISEVASRRGDAGTMYRDVFKSINDGALKLMSGDAGLAVKAFEAALRQGQEYTRQWGGFKEIPREPDAMVNAVRGGPAAVPAPPGAAGAPAPGTASTQVQADPNGQVTISPPGADPIAPAPVVPPVGQREMTPAQGGPPQPLPERGGVPVTSTPAAPSVPGYQPDQYMPLPGRGAPGDQPDQYAPLPGRGAPGYQEDQYDPMRVGVPAAPQGMAPPVGVNMDPYNQAVRAPAPVPQFSPDRAALKARFPGISDMEIDEALAELGTEAA